MKTYQLYIDGAYVDPAKGEWFESIDPYKGEPWAKIPRCGPEDVIAGRAGGQPRDVERPLGRDESVRAGQNHAARRRFGCRERQPAGRNRGARQWQAVRRDARAGEISSRMVVVLCWARGQDRRSADAHRQARHVCVYAARAGRGRGGADGVELPAALCCLEVRACSCGRLLRCRQAV